MQGVRSSSLRVPTAFEMIKFSLNSRLSSPSFIDDILHKDAGFSSELD